MNFDGMVNEVAERLNLTSDTAIDRIGRSINERYKRVCSSIGLETSSRGTVSASTTIGSRDVTFGPGPVAVEKVYAVTNPAFPNEPPLDVLFWDELKLRIPVSSDRPKVYGIKLAGARSVTITLDATPLSVYTLNADALLNKATLSGTMEPAFAESFHDILLSHAMSIELDKLEKPVLAKEKKNESEIRMGELRLFLAKEAYQSIQQGKNSRTHPTNPIWAG